MNNINPQPGIEAERFLINKVKLLNNTLPRRSLSRSKELKSETSSNIKGVIKNEL